MLLFYTEKNHWHAKQLRLTSQVFYIFKSLKRITTSGSWELPTAHQCNSLPVSVMHKEVNDINSMGRYLSPVRYQDSPATPSLLLLGRNILNPFLCGCDVHVFRTYPWVRLTSSSQQPLIVFQTYRRVSKSPWKHPCILCPSVSIFLYVLYHLWTHRHFSSLVLFIFWTR